MVITPARFTITFLINGWFQCRTWKYLNIRYVFFVKRVREKYIMSKLQLLGTDPDSLDQFLTKPNVAIECVKMVRRVFNLDSFEHIIEPAVGEGVFLEALRSEGVASEHIVYMDIDAADESIRRDFLGYVPPPPPPPTDRRSCLTIGNPPFGTTSAMAIAFFNHAALFSDVIAFVLPRSFLKRSIQVRLDESFQLCHTLPLPPNSFTFLGRDKDVPTVFMIWQRSGSGMKRVAEPRLSETDDFVFVNNGSDEPDAAVRRVGVNAGRIFTTDLRSRSRSSHHFIKVKARKREAIQATISRLKAIQLESCASKYDTAGCPSISKNELCLLYNKEVVEK
jgi:hypothetical protein